MKKHTLLFFCLVFALPACAEPNVQLWLPSARAPVSSTNPLPTSATFGASALVGVKGKDGTLIDSVANPLSVEQSIGGAVTSNTNPLPVKTQTVTQANITSLTASVPSVDTAVALTASSTHLLVKTDSSAAILYVDLTDGVATTADFRIDPGAGLSLDGLPGITSIHILGASATGTYSVAAW